MLLCKGVESSKNSGVLCQMGEMFWSHGCPAANQGHFLSKNGVCRKIQGNLSALTWLTAMAHDFLNTRAMTSDWYGQY